ncbi:hypothetical protein CHCC20335_3935 [Bacillus paralicheniformis]|nr:hypothetical protein CHCC20335_3935 [Bacillus paralicheniformis]
MRSREKPFIMVVETAFKIWFAWNQSLGMIDISSHHLSKM